MSARNRSSIAACIGLFLLTCALSAAEKPARVPWANIEAWVNKEAAPPPVATTKVATTAKTTKPVARTDTTPGVKTPEKTAPEKVDVPVARNVNRARPPKAWLDRYAEITKIMGRQLRTTNKTKHKTLFGINYYMEQYDKAMFHLTSMLKDAKNHPEEKASGWIAGRLWETALLQGGTPNPDILQKYYKDWLAGETARLQVQAGVISTSSLKLQKQIFAGHQAYFQECKNIAQMIKDKEREGASDPNALYEMCQRFYPNGHPHAPLAHLRFLYKLREWYPDYKHVKSGLVQRTIAFALADTQTGGDPYYRLHLYKAAAEEMELLIERYPASYAGYDHYYAGRYRMYHGDYLSERRERMQAREQWQKALDHFVAIKTKYPEHSYNKVDPDVGYSTADRWIRNCKEESRLGSGK